MIGLSCAGVELLLVGITMDRQENLDEDVFLKKDSLGNLIDLSLFGFLLEFNVCGNVDSTTITHPFLRLHFWSCKKVNFFYILKEFEI